MNFNEGLGLLKLHDIALRLINPKLCYVIFMPSVRWIILINQSLLLDLPHVVIAPIYDTRVLPPVLETSLSNASNNKSKCLIDSFFVSAWLIIQVRNWFLWVPIFVSTRRQAQFFPIFLKHLDSTRNWFLSSHVCTAFLYCTRRQAQFFSYGVKLNI